MSATSGGSASEGSEAGESSRSTVSVNDTLSGSFLAGENVTKITLTMDAGAGEGSDLTGSRVVLAGAGIDECDRSGNGVVNMAFVEEGRGITSEVDFKSINESDGKDKSAEAVNLELVNMVPYTNGNGTNYGIPVNGIPGIPVKKDVEQGEMGTPYDEYFVPVNEHKKFMRGEKLYVTKDKRRPPSWKKCLTWGIACIVITVVIILAILAGTGVILNQESNLVKEASVGRNFGDGGNSEAGTELTGKSSVTPPPSPTTDISPTTDLSYVRVPRSLESELIIDNIGYNPMLEQTNSSEYHSFIADLEEKLKMALFDYQILNYGASNIGLKVVNVSQSPLKVIFRIGWTFKQGIHKPPDPITLGEVREKLERKLETNNGYLGDYHIDANTIKVGNVMNLCRFDNGGCSHECNYDYGIKQQFVCSCPAPLVLDHTLKNCINLDEVTHGFTNIGLDAEPSPEPEPSAQPEPSPEPEPSTEPETSAEPKPALDNNQKSDLASGISPSSSDASLKYDGTESVTKNKADGSDFNQQTKNSQSSTTREHTSDERRIQSEFDGYHTAAYPNMTSNHDADGAMAGVSREHENGHEIYGMHGTHPGTENASPVTANDETTSATAMNHGGSDLSGGSSGDVLSKKEEGSSGRGFDYVTSSHDSGSVNGTHPQSGHGSAVIEQGLTRGGIVKEYKNREVVWSESATGISHDTASEHSSARPQEVIGQHYWRYYDDTIQSSEGSAEGSNRSPAENVSDRSSNSHDYAQTIQPSSAGIEDVLHIGDNDNFHGSTNHSSSADLERLKDMTVIMTPEHTPSDDLVTTQRSPIRLESSEHTMLNVPPETSSMYHESTRTGDYSEEDLDGVRLGWVNGSRNGGFYESAGTTQSSPTESYGSGHMMMEGKLHGYETQSSSTAEDLALITGGETPSHEPNTDGSANTTILSPDPESPVAERVEDKKENVHGFFRTTQSSPTDLNRTKDSAAAGTPGDYVNSEESVSTISSSPTELEGSKDMAAGVSSDRNMNADVSSPSDLQSSTAGMAEDGHGNVDGSFSTTQSSPSDLDRMKDSSVTAGSYNAEESAPTTSSSPTDLEGSHDDLATEMTGDHDGNVHGFVKKTQSSLNEPNGMQDPTAIVTPGHNVSSKESARTTPSSTDFEYSRHLTAGMIGESNGNFHDSAIITQSSPTDPEVVLHTMIPDHNADAHQISKTTQTPSDLQGPPHDKHDMTPEVGIDDHTYHPESNLNSKNGVTPAGVNPEKKTKIGEAMRVTQGISRAVPSNPEESTEKTFEGTTMLPENDDSQVLGSRNDQDEGRKGSESSRTHNEMDIGKGTTPKETLTDEEQSTFEGARDSLTGSPKYVMPENRNYEEKNGEHSTGEKPATADTETKPKDGNAERETTTYNPASSKSDISPGSLSNYETIRNTGDASTEGHGITEEPDMHTERTDEDERALILKDGSFASDLSPSVVTETIQSSDTTKALSPVSEDKLTKQVLEHDVDNESFNTLLGDEYSKTVSKEPLINKYKNKEKKKGKDGESYKEFDSVPEVQDGGKNDELDNTEERGNFSSEEANLTSNKYPDSKEIDSKLEKDHGKFDKDYKYDKQKVSKKKDGKKKIGGKDGKNFELDDKYITEVTGRTERKPVEDITFRPDSARTPTEREIRGYSVWEDVEDVEETGPTSPPIAQSPSSLAGTVKDGTEPTGNFQKFGSHGTSSKPESNRETNEEDAAIKSHYGFRDSNFHNISDDLEKDFPRDRIQVSGVRYPSFHISSGSDDEDQEGKSTEIKLSNSSVRIYSDGAKKYFETAVSNPELGGVNTTIRVYFDENGPDFDGDVKFTLPNGTQVFKDEKGNLLTALGDSDWLKNVTRLGYYDGKTIKSKQTSFGDAGNRVVHYGSDEKVFDPAVLNISFTEIPKWLLDSNRNSSSSPTFNSIPENYETYPFTHSKNEQKPFSKVVHYDSDPATVGESAKISQVVHHDAGEKEEHPAKLGGSYLAGQPQLRFDSNEKGYIQRVVYYDADGNEVDSSKLNISNSTGQPQQAFDNTGKAYTRRIVFYDSNGNVVQSSTVGTPQLASDTKQFTQRVVYYDADGNVVVDPSKLNISSNTGQPQTFDNTGKAYVRRILYYDASGNVIDPSMLDISSTKEAPQSGANNNGYTQKVVYYDADGNVIDPSKLNISGSTGQQQQQSDSTGKANTRKIVYYDSNGNLLDPSTFNISTTNGVPQSDNSSNGYLQRVVYHDADGNIVKPSTISSTGNNGKGYIQRIIYYDSDGTEVDPSKFVNGGSQQRLNGNGYHERFVYYDSNGNVVHPSSFIPGGVTKEQPNKVNFSRVVYYDAHGNIVDPATVNMSFAYGLSKFSENTGYTKNYVYYDANGNVIDPATLNETEKAQEWTTRKGNILYYDADGNIIDPTTVNPSLKSSPEWQLGNIGHGNISKVVFSDASGMIIDPSKLISSLVGRLSGWKTSTHPQPSTDISEHPFNFTITPSVVNGSTAFVNRIISTSPTFAVGNPTFRIFSNRNGTNNLTIPDEDGKIFISPEGHPSIKIGNSTVRIFSDENGKYFTSDGSPTFKVGNLTYRIYSRGNKTSGNGDEEVTAFGDNRKSDSAKSDFRMQQFQTLPTSTPERRDEANTILVPVTEIVTEVIKTNAATNFTVDRSTVAAGHDRNRTNFSKCAAGQFQCVNGTSRSGSACVSLSSKCDSINDCSDGSDELGCIENGCLGNFQCSDGTCLKRHLVCNGIVDCNDGSDEKTCEDWKCEFDEFQCPSGRCIPVVWQCDSKPDCDNHTDEYNCQTACGNDEFFCPEGWCVPLTYKCNGVKDCTSGEDEQFCDCAVDEFKCESGGCIPGNQVCDGTEQCPDRSDERQCIRTDNLLEMRASDGPYLPVCSDGWTTQHSDAVCATLGYSSSIQTDMKDAPVTDKQFFKLRTDSTDVSDFINKSFLVNLVRSNETCNSGKYIEVMCQPFSCGSPSMTESGLAGRLAGGISTVTGQWPSIALLYNTRNPHSCTANILTPRWALVSYSCLKMGNKNIQEQDWKLFSGSTVFEPEKETAETRQVVRILSHPQVKFNQFLYSNDVALVELSKPLDFGESVGAVCLPETEIQPRQICVTAGWGMDTPGEGVMKQHLQYLPIPTMDLENCNSSDHYSGFITNDKICAGYTASDKTLCYNEEGAPLMCFNDKGEWELHGVLSYHSNCGRGSHPSIFSSISSVRDWIENTTGTKYDRISALRR